jgi:hypothetical protein
MADQEAAISSVALEEALRVLRGRIASAEARRAEADQEIAKIREEETLLSRLLALRRGNAPVRPAKHAPLTTATEHIEGEGAKSGVLKAVQGELLKAGRPLHISDLMRLLTAQGVRIPGAGSQANLISWIRRDTRIVRPSRGMYGLTTWGLSEMTPKASRRKRRRRTRRLNTSQPEKP